MNALDCQILSMLGWILNTFGYSSENIAWIIGKLGQSNT